jgi:hypothetical protein
MPDATAIASATQCKETTVHHIHKQRLCLLAKTKTSDTKQSMCFLDQIRICVCVTLLHAALISCPLLCHAMPGKTSLCWPLCLCAGLFLAFRPHPPSARPAPLMPHAQWTTRATPCCWCKPSSRAIFASRLSVYRDSQAQLYKLQLPYLILYPLTTFLAISCMPFTLNVVHFILGCRVIHA